MDASVQSGHVGPVEERGREGAVLLLGETKDRQNHGQKPARTKGSVTHGTPTTLSSAHYGDNGLRRLMTPNAAFAGRLTHWRVRARRQSVIASTLSSCM